MTPEDKERLEAITDALARMVRRQTEIERRLARIESALKIVPAAPAETADRPPAQAVPPGPMPAAAPPGSAPSPRQQEPRLLEAAFGLTWLSRIGVVTVILALAFFFEYAFENHWITEWGRVALGLGCGAAALWSGERLWRSGQRTFAQALTAAGIAFLYLSFWAAFALYRLIGQPAAFALMLLTTGAAGALALRYEGAAIAALGLAGGYATPLLLGSEANPWFVLPYALVLNLAAGMVARARGWRWLEGLAFAGAAVLYLDQAGAAAAGIRWGYTVFVCLCYAQFAMAPLLVVSIAAQLLAGGALVQIWAPGTGVLVLVWAIAIAGLAVADRRGWPQAVGGSFAGFWMAYGLWRAGLGGSRPVGPPLALLTASFLGYLGWPAWRAGYRRQKLRPADLIVMALHAAFYFGAGYQLLRPAYGAYEGLFALATAAMGAAAARLLWQLEERAGLLAAGIAWALVVLAAPIQLAGYRVTLAWALEAAAIAWIGMRLSVLRAVYAAAAVFALTVLRLGFVDSTMYPSAGLYRELANARFLVFVVSAASLWAAAWWLRRQAWFAGPAYICGHAVLLWGLGLEVVGWAERTAAPQNVRSVISASLSVLAAAYAVALVAAGVFQRSALTRVLGVALIGLVVLKLYLYDVWLLGQFYRMAAFAILGVLLLVMSYFYSRFRESMESWWRS